MTRKNEHSWLFKGRFDLVRLLTFDPLLAAPRCSS